MIAMITAKCSDRCISQLEDGTEHIGYVPQILGIGGGDYIQIKFDTTTGQILDYAPASDEEIKEKLHLG